jgi:hypothetical protein
MYKKNLLNTALFAATAFAFVLTACDLPVADTLLDGKWTAVSGAQLEFSSGKFTRTTVTGSMETGTYASGGGYITFNRTGFTPETLPYNLNGTCLTVDITEYYRNSPGTPDNAEGSWTPIPDYGTAVILSPGKPQKGNPGIIEGEYVNVTGSKGKYTARNRNIPGSNTLTTTPTHVHGSNISTFVERYLNVNILELFDLSLIKAPGYDSDYWWFSLDETRNFFENAAGKAQTLEDQARIIAALQAYFYMHEPQTFDYSIEEDKDLHYDYTTAAEGKNRLTLRENDPWYGVLIYSYYKLKEDFGPIGPGPDEPTTPINPIDPNDPNGGWPYKPHGVFPREPFGNIPKILSKVIF